MGTSTGIEQLIVQDKKANLPEGWHKVRFDQMAESISDREDNPSEANVSYYVGLEHLDPDSLRIRRWGTPDDVEATKLRFKPGDIIFGRRRAYQRKVAIAEFEGICSAHALVLRACEETVLKDFLPFFMQSETFFERAMAISVGSLSPTINWKTLAQQEFDIPPKDEQRRIADILWAADEIVSKLNNCIQKAEQFRRDFLSQIILGSFKHTKFQDTAIGPLPSTWQFAPIANVGNVQLGRQRAPQYQTGEYSRPYLRVANVFDGYLNLEDVLQMDFDDHDYKKYKLCPGDILLNEGQSRELVGRSCIYLGEIEGCCFQNTLIRFQSSDQLLPEFAFGYFQHAFYQGIFAQMARQTTSIAHLGAERFAKILIPVPPLAEQYEIVRYLEVVNQSSNQLKGHAMTATRIKERLLNHMLSKD